MSLTVFHQLAGSDSAHTSCRQFQRSARDASISVSKPGSETSSCTLYKCQSTCRNNQSQGSQIEWAGARARSIQGRLTYCPLHNTIQSNSANWLFNRDGDQQWPHLTHFSETGSQKQETLLGKAPNPIRSSDEQEPKYTRRRLPHSWKQLSHNSRTLSGI